MPIKQLEQKEDHMENEKDSPERVQPVMCRYDDRNDVAVRKSVQQACSESL